MGCISLDLTIDGALVDPVIAAAMRADRIAPQDFERLLRLAARDLDGARRSRDIGFALRADKLSSAVTGTRPLW